MPDIMQYESAIFAIADDLIAVSIKQSDFPAFMMPFFALMMLEGRMRNMVRQVEEKYETTAKDNPDDFREMFRLEDCGFNEYIVIQGKTLAVICANDQTFEQDFKNYLEAFDPDLKRLLGVGRGREEAKFLDIDGKVAELRAKKILLTVASKWANIDLSPYDNSAITTLEEHIKRRWADISASTAGEQYTPDDIISLIAEIVSDKITKSKNEYIHIYDPTCGGANLLFGVADRLSTQNGYDKIATYGSEWNDALYALAAIESRFRNNARIEYGNTLTRVPFSDKPFDVIVANPPYGTKWTGYQSAIEGDQRGQFAGGLPAISDGQLLFMQHILWQLGANGIAVEVHNGSTLFSGDAGEGESNIRKYIFDRDWVEAIIQMPQNEFFNTGIYTYLWIMNKNKPASRKNLVALIDGSNGWSLLKKSKGDKRREMLPEHRAKIVQSLHDFRNNDICKIFNREHFYYNKQGIILTELDDEGRFLEEDIKIGTPKSIVLGSEEITEFANLDKESADALLKQLKAFDYKETPMTIVDEDGVSYTYNADTNTIEQTTDDVTISLGRGKFVFSLGTSKKLKTLKVELTKELTPDYEIIPHHFDEAANEAEISAFLQKYVFKPYERRGNVVGVELNFNKEFYVPEKIDSVEDILAELKSLDEQLMEIEL